MRQIAQPTNGYDTATYVVDRFVEQFGEPEAYRKLAWYAALPLVLTPELLNYLRNMFLRGEVPWVAEVDLLLSDLCSPSGYELYVMDTEVRAYLLAEMRANLGLEPMQKVAQLLIHYVRHVSQTNQFFAYHQLQAQQWAAMVYLDDQREHVVQEMAEAFRTSVGHPLIDMSAPIAEVDQAALTRLALITQTLAPELTAYPQLVEYARNISLLLSPTANRNSASAVSQRYLRQSTHVVGIELPALEALLGPEHMPQAQEYSGPGTTEIEQTLTEPARITAPLGQREGLVDLLVDRVLDSASHERKERSTVIRGAGKSGKTWLLQDIRQRLLAHPQHPIVLSLSSVDFSKRYTSEDALFQAILTTFWSLVEQATSEIQADTGPLLPPLDDFKGHPISFVLTDMASRISTVMPPQYIIILLDGIEEIPLMLLKQFEQQFISPMFKFPCVRMIATCRKIPNSLSDPSWSTRAVRVQTRRLELPGFDIPLAAEQFQRIKDRRLMEEGVADPVTFEQLQAQLPTYAWNSPGANAFLIRGALDDSGQITTEVVKNTINRLLVRPDGRTFDSEYKDLLFKLVKAHPDFEAGLRIAKINETLGISDYERNMFTSELWAAGHGEIDAHRRLIVNHEIVALIRELQARR